MRDGDAKDIPYGDAGNNCHQFFYLKGAQYQPCRNPTFKRRNNRCKPTAKMSTMVCGEAPAAKVAAGRAQARVEFTAIMKRIDADELGAEEMIRAVVEYGKPDVLIDLVRRGKIDANFAGRELPTPLMVAVHQRDDATALQSVGELLALGAGANVGVRFTSELTDFSVAEDALQAGML